MGLASLVGLDGTTLGSRFSLVSSLPTAAGTLVVVFVLMAGAPSQYPSWDRAVAAARGIDAADVALLAVAITAVAVAAAPLQQQLVRLLEGYWGGGRLARRLAAPLISRHRRARERLLARAVIAPDAAAVSADAAIADQQRRARFPSEAHLLPTALGNALRAAERSAGRRYGLDAVLLWPRLYPLLPEPVRAIVADRRDQLDLGVRMSAMFALVAAVTATLLWRYPWWWSIPVAAGGLSLLAYRAAVAAAVAYGESLHVAFDLHRFDLLTALHLPLPADPQAERAQNTGLSTALRQGDLPLPGYRHPAK